MQSIRPAALCAVTLLAIAACNRGDTAGKDVLAQDSSLTRDLQLANSDTLAQPQLNDVATTPPPAPAPAKPKVVEERRIAVTPPSRKTAPGPKTAPVTSTPAQSPPVPTVTPSGNTVVQAPAGGGNTEGTVGVVAMGTNLTLSSGQKVCTNTNSVGDRITATLAQAVTASNGVVMPVGATAVLEISSLDRSDKAGDSMEMGFIVRSISYGGKTYPVNGEIVSAAVEKVKAADNNNATKVAGGAVVGAILGNIFGGHSRTKGTIIGAAGGAAAGAVLAHQTEKYDACLPSGAQVVVRLDAPMSIQAATAKPSKDVI